MKIALVILLVLVVLVALLAFLFQEAFRSDSANAFHKNARLQREALSGARRASAQAPAAREVGGDELHRLLAGKTHIKEYRKQAHDSKPYLTTYDYFGPDGAYTSSDTYSKRAPGYEWQGRWEVAGDILCITETRIRETTSCFKIRLSDAGMVQYWNYQPGEDADGLLASIVSIIRPGLQTPEYASDPAAFR